MANTLNEFLRDLISLSYKLDQMIDESDGSDQDVFRAIRDHCDDVIARMLGLEDGPIVACPTVASPAANPAPASN